MKKAKLLVGCPVYRRDWILPLWFQHVEVAAVVAGVDIQYVFVADPDDSETLAEILSAHHPVHWVCQPELIPHDGRRVWNHDRFKWMVDLRNILLRAVRDIKPDLFLSLDSDILLNPLSIKSMMEGLDRFDAVGGKLYMTGGTTCPSWATFSRSAGLSRQDAEGFFPVEVIMACKLMTPMAFNVDYVFHEHGEDVGWSLAASMAGCRLGWDGRVANKHVMERGQEAKIDPRVGY